MKVLLESNLIDTVMVTLSNARSTEPSYEKDSLINVLMDILILLGNNAEALQHMKELNIA